ncbi:Cytochrome p450 [Thalictrum thalictroides]|uniref:Cytochrome p450 n=1 Tax=Thalictrum thalictroides TaxID=46969 RepID=A0A7J6V4S9_THATH|nr:Cytochrome p450 [Thalictrum thalictroides]
MLMSKNWSSESENQTEEIIIMLHEVEELTEMLDLSDCIWFCRHLGLQGIMKRTENNNTEFKLTRENIKAVIIDLFVAGTDTSAKTMEWAFAELINHPHIFQKAREEIDSVVGKNRLVKESDIPNLPYLQAIVKETHRLHPPGPLLARRATEYCKVGEYDIAKNTRLLVNVWAIGRDVKHWENPLEFRPNRFLTEEGSLKSQLDVRGHHYQLLPFGSGQRGCPGISLALQSVQTTLAILIQCFDLRVADGKGATVDMIEAPGILLTKANPLRSVPVLAR